MKIDKRKKYICVLDTETANTLTEDDKLIMDYVLPYDIGYIIMDTKGQIYLEKSFIVRDIFFYENKLMSSAYYAEKIPLYEKDLEQRKRQIRSAYEIRKQLIKDMETYNCSTVCCHNARFDVNALNNLIKWTTKSKFRYFLPYGTEVWDTMKMANDVICQMPTYIKFCNQNPDRLTAHGKPRKTAEILYQFITKDEEFVESHMGLEDVLIEKEIFLYCCKQHKPMRKGLYQKEYEGRQFLKEKEYIYRPFED